MGVGLLVAVLITIQTTTVHLEMLRLQQAGISSGITRLLRQKNMTSGRQGIQGPESRQAGSKQAGQE